MADRRENTTVLNENLEQNNSTNMTTNTQTNNSSDILAKCSNQKCSVCGVAGHYRSTCPNVTEKKTCDRNRLQIQSRQQPRQQIPTRIPLLNNLSSCCYVVFDIETTGFSPQRNEIIQIAAKFLDHDGGEIDNGSFNEFVKPTKRISNEITALTGISNDTVDNCDNINAVWNRLIRFLYEKLEPNSDSDDANSESKETDKADTDNADGLVHGKHIILVAHNGRVFDIPFLLSKLSLDIDLSIFKYEIDTMYLAKLIIVEKKLIVPTK